MEEKNTFYVLNNLIYNIYNTADFEQMKSKLLRTLDSLVPNCCASLFLTDPLDNDLLIKPMCVPHSYIQMENRYLKVKNRDFSDWIIQKKQPQVIRGTDFMYDEEREQTDYYKLAFAPYGIHHVMYVNIASHNKLLGLMVLYRRKDEPAFSDRDVFLLQLLNEHLNIRFHQEFGDETKRAVSIPQTYELMIDYGMTAREAEIAGMVLGNMKNTEICGKLDISINTLKKHLQNMYRKLNVTSKKEMVDILSKI